MHKRQINELTDKWHRSAAEADLEPFFSYLAEDAMYLGTDASERWTKKEFFEFCKPYFDKGKAWDFKAKERHIYIKPELKTAWFDEVLDTWMGECRGSGVLIYENNTWKLIHYNLAVAVPNDIIRDYIDLIK
jgi:hypothetical protein